MPRVDHGVPFFVVKCHSPNRRIALTVTLLCALTACNKLGLGGNDPSPTAPSGPPPSASVASMVYSAIGASDANGIGSSVPCLPFAACGNGMGYVPVTVRQLSAQGFKITLRNLGLPTAVIGRDFQDLGRQYGRTIEGNFIEDEMPFVLQDSTIVTIFAGINEINTITAALGGGAGGNDRNAYIDNQVGAFGADYTTLINGIRSRAAGTRFVVLNVPNAAGMPFLANASIAQRQAAQRAAVLMTTRVINPLVSPLVTVVDVMCDSRSYQRSNYSSDGLHPNDAGYANIAAEIVRGITTVAAYPTPKGSCAPMTLVP